MAQPLNPSASPAAPWQGEAFEFELTDIDDARRILDLESLSQFDVATVGRPEHWKRLRRAKLPSDRALTGPAIDWLLALPQALRPEALSRQFPRIVNTLADAWSEPERCQATFEQLLSTQRRERQGFPAAVLHELVALRNWVQVF